MSGFRLQGVVGSGSVGLEWVQGRMGVVDSWFNGFGLKGLVKI